MGNAFIAATGAPAGWLASTIVQCGPSLAAARQRRELQSSPTPTMSPAVGSAVIFTYVVRIPPDAPAAQVTAAQNGIASLSTASPATVTSSLVSASFPSASVTSVYGSVNGVACGSAAGLPSCASLFSPAPSPAPATTPIGAIVGGVVGGLVAIAVIALAVFFCRRAQLLSSQVADLKAAAAAAQADPTPRSRRRTASQFTAVNPMPSVQGEARTLSTRTTRSPGAEAALDDTRPGVLPSPLSRSARTIITPSRVPVAPIIYASPVGPHV